MEFTVVRKLETVDGSVEFVARRSGVIAARLSAKKSLLFALYGKANLLEKGAELDAASLFEAEEIAIQHDIDKMLYAIKSWSLPAEAFVLELEEYPVDKGSIELLRDDVFGEINNIITELWEKPAKSDDELKNSIQPSTPSPTPEPPESSSTDQS